MTDNISGKFLQLFTVPVGLVLEGQVHYKSIFYAKEQTWAGISNRTRPIFLLAAEQVSNDVREQ